MALSQKEMLFNQALGYIGEYRVEEGATSTKQYIICERYFEDAVKEVLVSHLWNEAMARVILIQQSSGPVFGYDNKYSKPSDALRIVSVDNDLGSDQRNKARGVDAWEVEGEYILSNAGANPPSWSTGTEYFEGQYVSVTPDTWAAGTSYIDGQYLKSDGNVYEVLSDHTSDTIANDLASANIANHGTGSKVSYEVLADHTSTTVTDDITSGYISASGDVVDANIVYVTYIKTLSDITRFSPKLKWAIAVKLAIKIITSLTNDTRGKEALINEYYRIILPDARSVDAMQQTPTPIFNSEWIRSRYSGTQ